MPKKNNHTHKTVFTWFGNLPTTTELQGYHYYQGRIQSTTCGYNIFSLYIKHGNNTTLKNPNYKRRAYRPKPPLHRLSLSKSPIKNHAILFGSGRVGSSNRIKQNQAPQSPTMFLFYINIFSIQIYQTSFFINYFMQNSFYNFNRNILESLRFKISEKIQKIGSLINSKIFYTFGFKI